MRNTACVLNACVDGIHSEREYKWANRDGLKGARVWSWVRHERRLTKAPTNSTLVGQWSVWTAIEATSQTGQNNDSITGCVFVLCFFKSVLHVCYDVVLYVNSTSTSSLHVSIQHGESLYSCYFQSAALPTVTTLLTMLRRQHSAWPSRICLFRFKQISIFTLVCTLRAHAEEGSRKGHVCKCVQAYVCVSLSELSDQAHHRIISYTKHIWRNASEYSFVCMDICRCACVGVFWRNCALGKQKS